MDRFYNESQSLATQSTNRFSESSSNFYYFPHVNPLPSYLKPSNRFSELTNQLKREQFTRPYDASRASIYSDTKSKLSNSSNKLPSINMGLRKKELVRQSEENLRLMQRLLDAKPVVSRRKLERDWRRNKSYIMLGQQFPPYAKDNKLKTQSQQELSKLSDFNTSSVDRKSFSELRNLPQLKYKDQFVEKNTKKNQANQNKKKLKKRVRNPNVSLNSSAHDVKRFYKQKNGHEPNEFPIIMQNSAETPIRIQDIIEFIEQNGDSEGEYEVFYYGNDSSTPVNQLEKLNISGNLIKTQQKSKQSSILKSQSFSIGERILNNTLDRPSSKVSFQQNGRLKLAKPEMKKQPTQYMLPDTNELLIEVPDPALNEESSNEIEIIYVSKSRNDIARSTSLSRTKSRIDHDRIQMVYDDKRNSDNIHVVYNNQNYKQNYEHDGDDEDEETHQFVLNRKTSARPNYPHHQQQQQQLVPIKPVYPLQRETSILKPKNKLLNKLSNEKLNKSITLNNEQQIFSKDRYFNKKQIEIM